MATQADVRRIALSLPETEEEKGHFAFGIRIKGKLKGYAWVWLERVAPKKPRVANPAVLAVRVANLSQKDLMIAAEPTKFFTEPHYISSSARATGRGERLRASRAAQGGLALSGAGGACETPQANKARLDVRLLRCDFGASVGDGSSVGAIEILEEDVMTERPGYGDAEAKRIIERAAEIDVEQGRQLDALALREIAAQAGISPLAVDRALEEHESTALKRVPWWRRHRTMLTIAAFVALLLIYALARRVFPT